MAHSILDVARELIDSPEAKTAYADDPDGFIAERGLDGLSDADLQEAVGLVADAMPAPVARQLAVPPGPVTDSLPLARVAAATSMDVAVLDADPGTVDLAALADPSGQLDLPTDVGLADASEVVAAAETETPQEEADDSEPAEEDETVSDETDFGRGALDETDELPAGADAEPDEGDEPDNLPDPGLDDGDLATPEPDFGPDDATDVPAGGTSGAPETDEDPPEDDLEDVII